MGTYRAQGIIFVAYWRDHPPRHVHGFLAETEVIVSISDEGQVTLADRKDAIRPDRAKKSHIQRILQVAAENAAELIALWEVANDAR